MRSLLKAPLRHFVLIGAILFPAHEWRAQRMRLIEIPTPRWTAYDAKRFAVKPLDGTRITVTERGYTSPIWYTPGNRKEPGQNFYTNFFSLPFTQ